MTDDENQIRDLIDRWVRAVQAGDPAGVLADHTDDVVMYDVPPPFEGNRGIEAYERSWPDFLRRQRDGARFELTELDVTVGGPVAFAYALLRCGTDDELARRPELRLRLTFGLRKWEGRWAIAHEHHSFPADDGTRDRTVSESAVRDLHRRWFEATAAGDLDGLMRPIAADVVSYEHEQPLEHVGRDRVREICAAGLRAGSGGDVTWTVPDMTVVVRDDLAVSWGLNRVTARDEHGDVTEIWSRGTRVFRRVGPDWQLVHQHLSFPLDPETGWARTDLVP